MRGGNGTVRIEHYWDKDDLKSRTRLCARLVIEPGSSIGFHEHVDEEEVFVILRGQGTVQDGNARTAVGPGDTPVHWTDVTDGDGNDLPTGVYIVRLQTTTDGHRLGKMVLLR